MKGPSRVNHRGDSAQPIIPHDNDSPRKAFSSSSNPLPKSRKPRAKADDPAFISFGLHENDNINHIVHHKTSDPINFIPI